MITEEPKRLPDNISMSCYACEKEPATHIRRFKLGELAVQVCLCADCMKMDTQYLLKNTVGIQDVQPPAVAGYLSHRNSVVPAP